MICDHVGGEVAFGAFHQRLRVQPDLRALHPTHDRIIMR